jgi:hypothetical protein
MFRQEEMAVRHALVVFVALTTVVTARAEVPCLTPAAMASWRIVCDARATESERYAAGEFQLLFRGMTGKTLPIAAVPPGSGGAVYIGPGAVVRSGQRMPAVKLGEEGLRIRLSKDALCIDGGRPRGTLYGVYEFFEELCGVRYLTYDHTYYPPNAKSHKLPLGTRTFLPTFAFRWSYYGETSRRPDFAARLHTNTVSTDPKLGGKTGYQLVNHCVAYLVPPAKYGKEHPEFYALVNGRRIWDTTDGGGPQLCLTNPHVRDVVVQSVLEEIKKNPAARNINIAQMDNDNYCTCPRCKALDAREGSHSGTMIAFVNSVAERIEKKHPKVLLSTFAYWYTRKPPKTLRPRHNVMVQLCSIECCDLHAIDDPACALNREFCHDMAVWNTKCDKIFIWHYNTNFSGYMLPFPNLRSIGKSVLYFAKHSGRGVFMQSAGNGFSTEMSDLRNYVMSRCLWKPGRDSWKEAMEFCRLHYGESSGPIIAYLTYYHHLVASKGVHPTCFPTESGLCINPQSTRRMIDYFRQAMALAKSDTVRARVEKASLCAYRAALSVTSMQITYEDGICRPDLTGLDPRLLDNYDAMCRTYGVTMESEQMAVGTYIDGLRKFHAGLKAICIENDTWRLVVLPGSNAKLVEMTYKPTGRNVIRPFRAFNRFRYEEWVRDGAGPGAQNIHAFDVLEAQPDRLVVAMTAEDGTRFERTISLAGDTVRFDTAITAGTDRSLDLWVHPEYDAGTPITDSRILGVYIKHGERWVRVTRTDRAEQFTQDLTPRVQAGLAGGAFAYYNHRAGFGVEQRYDPVDFRDLGLYWMSSRQQVNLELMPKVTSLKQGAQARYSYEVRYLSKPPVK